MTTIRHYFPQLSPLQQDQFARLKPLYDHWNAQINVISRKDMDAFYLHHVLHSLGIAKVQPLLAGSTVLDIGTGGGFPGIPLAILFPDTHFLLVDAIGKKVKVVQEVAATLGLKNVRAEQARAEAVQGSFDFIVSRAVTRMDTFVKWSAGKIAKDSRHSLKNGILYLKGGDLSEELKDFPSAAIYELKDFFTEAFFETKKVVHLPR